MRHTLLATVGTSLANNLAALGRSAPDADEPSAIASLRALAQGIAPDSPLPLPERIAETLHRLPRGHRLAGAEVNTVEAIARRREMDLQRLVLLPSDTEAGRSVAEVLRAYFEAHDDLRLAEVCVEPVGGLREDEPSRFKSEGLRNLVHGLARYVQRYGHDYVAIDATGGYKAQIALAALLGQALNVPVFYKHERFDAIIDLPPMPVTLDYGLLGRHADILAALDGEDLLTSDELSLVPPRLRSLLESVRVGDRTLYALGPVGQVVLEGFRARYPSAPDLRPARADERDRVRLRDDHSPDGFGDFLQRVFDDTPYLTRAYSVPYDGQRGLRAVGFHVRREPEGLRLVATYVDRAGVGARAHLRCTDESETSLVWAAADLSHRFA